MQPFVAQRLHNQQLEQTHLQKPEDVVRWLGAVQAQEYPHAKWALGLRLNGIQEAAIEQALQVGKILRTHVMRPTWHFVTSEDIRWLLQLTAPRVHAGNAYYYRKFELDDALFKQSNVVMLQALEGGKQLTRTELAALLEKTGIVADGLRLSYIMMQAELDGLICSGTRRGNQFTYALLDERVPSSATMTQDEALAELTKRYFTSHGPALVQDFAWWSGLTQADVKKGLDLVKPHIVAEVINDKTYWRAADVPDLKPMTTTPKAILLPIYDEYTIAYKDHSMILDPLSAAQVSESAIGGAFIMDGRLLGFWRRTLKKNAALIETAPFRALSEPEQEAFAIAAQQYGEFIGLPVELV